MTVAYVRLRDPSYEKDGSFFVDPEAQKWGEIPYNEDPEQCSHDSQMCNKCLPEWENDHEVLINPEEVPNPLRDP